MRKLFLATTLLCSFSAFAVQAQDMLPPGPLATQGRQIVDQTGKPVRLAGAAYWISNPSVDLPRLAKAGFNTIRVSMVNRRIDSDLAKIDQVVAAASKVGVRVIIDNHTDEGLNAPCWAQQANGLPWDSGPGTDGTDGCGVQGTVTRARWISDWVKVAQRYKGNTTVIGYDLRNEPLQYGTGSRGVSWGDGDQTRDLRLAYQDAGNAILAVDSTKLIICEGPQNYGGNLAGIPNVKTPWGDLTGVKKFPVVLNVPNRVVYSVHDYPQHVSGFSPDSGSAKNTMADQAFGFVAKQNIAPLYIGEWAADNLPGGDQAYADTFIAYYNDPAMGPAHTSYWMWGYDANNPNSGLLDSHSNLRQAQMQVVDQLLYHANGTPTPSPVTAPSPDRTVVMAGSTAVIMDANGNQWTITSGGQVAVNGVADTTTGRVLELAYVGGTLWQENADHLWWGKKLPTDAWTPPAGTATSPLATSTPATPSPDGTTVMIGSTNAIIGSTGDRWGLNASGQVTVNGVADTTTANVVELAYAGGKVWQKNSANLWWYKIRPSDSWQPSAGTSVSPLVSSDSITMTVSSTSGADSFCVYANGQQVKCDVAPTAATAFSYPGQWGSMGVICVAQQPPGNSASKLSVSKLAYDGAIRSGNATVNGAVQACFN